MLGGERGRPRNRRRDPLLSGLRIQRRCARLRDDIAKAWYVDARIENVFDRNYELAYQYDAQYNTQHNTPRRGAYVTLGRHPS
jgi:vitamin B12 transporter